MKLYLGIYLMLETKDLLLLCVKILNKDLDHVIVRVVVVASIRFLTCLMKRLIGWGQLAL